MLKIIKEIGFRRLGKYFLYGLWQWVFDLLPYSPLRVFWLRLGGAKIGRGCVVEKICFINLDRTGLKGLTLGEDCFIGSGVLLDLAGRITLENQVTLSPRCVILSHHSVGFSDHPLIKFYPKKVFHTVVRAGTVVGVAAIILPGIIIGSRSLIGAASVVNKDIPERVMAAGIPAQVKKKLE